MGNLSNFRTTHLSLIHVCGMQILAVVEKNFNNPFVKEHLILAISSMDSTEQPSSPLFAKVI